MVMSAAHRDFLSYLQRPFDVLVVHLGRGQVRFEGHLEGGKRGKTLSRRTLNYCILPCAFLFLFCVPKWSCTQFHCSEKHNNNSQFKRLKVDRRNKSGQGCMDIPRHSEAVQTQLDSDRQITASGCLIQPTCCFLLDER